MNDFWLRRLVIIACASLAVGPAALAPALAKPVLRAKNACAPVPSTVACTLFPPLTKTVLREISITVSSPGFVFVTVNGSGLCYSNDSTFQRNVTFATQLTDSATAPAVGHASGGLRIAERLEPQGQVSFNLGSSRTFSVPEAGSYTYYLKIRPLSPFNEEVPCQISGLNMTALFVPH